MTTTMKWYDDDLVKEVRYDDDDDDDGDAADLAKWYDEETNHKSNGLDATPDFQWHNSGTSLYYCSVCRLKP